VQLRILAEAEEWAGGAEDLGEQGACDGSVGATGVASGSVVEGNAAICAAVNVAGAVTSPPT